MQNSIYITYNPYAANEKNIALDLYKKGRQNGYFIYMPERNAFNQLSQQTKYNIDSSNWFVIFSTSHLSDTVQEEIEYALKTKSDSQIIVIYSKHFGKNIDFHTISPVEMYIDDYNIQSIETFKIDLFEKISPKIKKQSKEGLTALEVILGVGAAIVLLDALTASKKK